MKALYREISNFFKLLERAPLDPEEYVPEFEYNDNEEEEEEQKKKDNTIRKIKMPKQEYYELYGEEAEKYRKQLFNDFNYDALSDAIDQLSAKKQEFLSNLKKKNTYLFLIRGIREYYDVVGALYKSLKEIELTHKKDFTPKYIKILSYTIRQYCEIIFYIEETLFRALIEVFNVKPPKKDNRRLINMEYVREMFDKVTQTPGEYKAWGKKYQPEDLDDQPL